jgi:DNA-directed RNA polymerase
MAKNDLVINKDKALIENGSPEDLQVLAEKKATEILQKIDESNARIAEANDAADKAKAMKSGGIFGGKTRIKADATANALVTTNKAVTEMNNLIQESVRFTCASVHFAQVMHKTMAFMMVQGFRDSNGNIKKLAGDSKRFAQQILDEADDFVQKQFKVESKQTELQEGIEANTQKIDKNRESIGINAKQIEGNRNIIDTHTKQIEYLQRKFDENDQLNKEQNAIIEKNMNELKSTAALKHLTFVLSVVALLISIGMLIFFVMHLYL